MDPSELVYALRQPKFPVICDVAGHLIAALTPRTFHDQLAQTAIPLKQRFRMVDASGQGWVLDTEHMMILPSFRPHHWRKLDVIRMFNNSRDARDLGEVYSERSLSNKRIDRIVTDIARLIANRAAAGDGGGQRS